MQYLRFSVACLSALACLGTGYADARPPGTRLSVVICVAQEPDPPICGPRVKVSRGKLGATFPPIAKRSGVVSAPFLKIKCPGVCEAAVSRAVKVTITAWPTRPQYALDHWEGSCAGNAPTCTLRVSANALAKAVFRSDYDPDGARFQGP